ncbi:MAG: hypothetical protein SFX73_01765 [Kofleriaceae bacterium]|nr:hypothetical protein [Kofleriaceae bacterium]
MKHTLLTTLLLTACAADDGLSPQIANLTYTPSTATHGQVVTITGTFTFTDDDGDLAELGAEITLPDRTTQTFPMSKLGGVGDMTTGTLGLQLQVLPPTAGSYAFSLWITDEAGNESNPLEGTLTAN